MKRSRIFATGLAAAAIVAGSFSLGQRTASASVPEGIDRDHWYQLSADVGLEIQPARSSGGSVGRFGRLMVREDGQWRPITLETPSVVPAR